MLSTESPDNLSERDYLHRYVLNNRVGAPGSMAPILEKLRTIVAFDDYCISGLDFDDYRVGAGIFLASSLPERFLREYADNQLIKKDPLAELISPERTVAQWQGVSGKPAACPVEDLLRRYHVAPRTVISLWSGGRLYGGGDGDPGKALHLGGTPNS